MHLFKPLVVMILGFYCFYVLALLMQTRVEHSAPRRTSWVKALMTQSGSQS